MMWVSVKKGRIMSKRLVGCFVGMFMFLGILSEHMRFYDVDENVVYWYHGIDVRGGKNTKFLLLNLVMIMMQFPCMSRFML